MVDIKYKYYSLLCMFVMINGAVFGQSTANGIDSANKSKLEFGASFGVSLIDKINQGQGIDQFFGSKVQDYSLNPNQGRTGFQYLNMKIGYKPGNGGLGLSASMYKHASNAVYGQHQNINSANLEWATFRLGFTDLRLGFYVGSFNKTGKVRFNAEMGAIFSTMTGNLNWKNCPVVGGYDISNAGTGYYYEIGLLLRLVKGIYFGLDAGNRNLKVTEKHKANNTGATQTFNVVYSNATEPLKLDWGGTYIKMGISFLL